MKRFITFTSLCIFVLALLLIPEQYARADRPVVHALLFYSPTCPHCHKVITEDLPLLMEKYGDQLVILGININEKYGWELYQTAVDHFEIPEEDRGVPMLVVGETALIGSGEIPQKFPTIVSEGLESGGIDFPDLLGLPTILEAVGITAQIAQDVSPEPKIELVQDPDQGTLAEPDFDSSATMESFEKPAAVSLAARFSRDPAGNTLSILVLLGMVLTVVWVMIRMASARVAPARLPHWVTPLLLTLGIGIALYLSYVEVSRTEAVCGPVGDCNTVQSSSYAYLFGILPIGVIGMTGYLLIGTAWMMMSFGPDRWRRLSTLSLWGLALIATLFSIYLTFLEPFVIGATCAWCLSSSVVVTLLLLAATAPAMRVWHSL